MNSGTRLYSFLILFWFSILHNAFTSTETERFQVTPVSLDLRNQMKLANFYQKRVAIGNFSVLGSKNVSDFALKEAAYLISQMTSIHPEYLQKLTENKVRFSVMARDEFTTDIPEHADLSPAIFWDKRARGLGATPARPSVSCGEENLLGIEGDPYKSENILIHEFAHALHAMAINDLDSSFNSRLEKCFELAVKEKIWFGTYAESNPAEYWAEGVQSWYDCNRANDREHGKIDSREDLIRSDPRLAKLIQEKLGEQNWRYVHISKRVLNEQHLKGFNSQDEQPFAWPKELIEWHEKFAKGEVSIAPTNAKKINPLPDSKNLKSTYSRKRCKFFIHNLSGEDIKIHWVDFEGKFVQPRLLRHKDHTMIHSFVDHCWHIKSEKEKDFPFTNFYKLPHHNSAELIILHSEN